YILMVKFRWVDTLAALIIPALNNAFAILLFRQAFKSIPNDLIDAARMDGCGELRIIYQILWPNIIPTIITVGILTFMNSWNDVLWPLIVIRDEQLMTMPQLVTLFAVGGRAEAQLGVKLASAVLLALPIIIAYSIFQKHFIRSMASSGLKG
nr:carbohydrate ABC transporter permease [Saprospiraceae bacterium]